MQIVSINKYVGIVFIMYLSMCFTYGQTDTIVFQGGNRVIGEVKNMQKGVLEIDVPSGDENFKIKFEPKDRPVISTTSTERSRSEAKKSQNETIKCPKCQKGTVLKGKTAYGCSEYKQGCDFRFTFENVRKIANGKPLTKELVLQIISN